MAPAAAVPRGCTAATSRQFTKVADEERQGARRRGASRATTIVVPQPTCGYVLKKDYVDYVGGADAELVAENTYDAAEYLMKVHKAEGTALDTDFAGTSRQPSPTTPRATCKAQNVGLKSRDLIKLTGAKVKLVQQCSGIDGMWGLRAQNTAISVPMAPSSSAIRSGARTARSSPVIAISPTRRSPSRRASSPSIRCN